MSDARHVPIERAELAVVGLVRNCAKYLLREIDSLTRATRAFSRIHFLVIESDSTDNTVEVLRTYKREVSNFDFISLGALDTKHPIRTDRLAVCRNRYLDELETPKYAAVNYVLIADLDGVNRDLKAEALRSCWTQGSSWDVVCANQLDRYYDIWALRHPVWCPVDCKQHAKALEPLFGRAQAVKLAVTSRKLQLPTTAAWVEVESAFGGLAIYRREALHGVRYRGLDESGVPICEHVPLHAALRERGGRIFINPALINTMHAPHTGRKEWHVRLRRKLEATGDRLRARWGR